MGEPAGRVPGVATDVGRPHRGGPTVLRILIGAQLRRLREYKGISAEQAGLAIRGSQSKISRMELGRIGFKERDVADLLTLYGVADESEREVLLELARQANTPAWWHRYSDVMPSWLEVYVGLEEASSAVRAFEARHVPDLLQTRDYAGSVGMLGQPNISLSDLERQVDFKVRRQRLLGKAEPRLWFLLDEAILRRPLGDEEVMLAQLEHLIEVGNLSNVTLQVLPSGAARSEGGGFSILRFPDPSLPDVVYLEHLTSALYLDKPTDVGRYVMEFGKLCVAAADPADSRGIIRAAIADLKI